MTQEAKTENQFETLYKSAYFFQDIPMRLNINRHQETHEIFILTHKGKFYHVYALQGEEEKRKVCEAIMRGMTKDELAKLKHKADLLMNE